MARLASCVSVLLLTACGGVSSGDPDGGESAVDGGPGADADGLDAAPVAPNVIFVTSTTHTGAIGGLAGADSICNAAAIEAGLDGTFAAWLSTTTVDARDRLDTASGWVRADGEPFGATIADILAGRIFYPPNVEPSGVLVPFDVAVWTATGIDGTYSGDGDCGGFTLEVGNALLGDGSAGFDTFTSAEVNSCAEPARLLCMGLDRAGQIEPPNAQGRLAFVSKGRPAGNQGVTAFNSICASEATSAGFGGVFVAAVFSGGETIGAQLDLEAETWVRPDGVQLFAAAADLEDPSGLRAPLSVHADGTPINSPVWSGKGQGIPRNCADFTDATDNAITGSSSHSSVGGFGRSAASCAGTLPVYCLER